MQIVSRLKKPKALMKTILFFSLLLSLVLGTLMPVQALAFTDYSDPTEAIHYLQPLDSEKIPESQDESLTDHLKVTIYEKNGTDLVLVDEFTSGTKGSERIRLEDGFYMLTWHTSVPTVGGEFLIVTSVAGMEVGSLDITLASGKNKEKNKTDENKNVVISARGGVPIKFVIENHPAIRVRVMTEDGRSATEIARVLNDEFGTSAEEAASLLIDENYDSTSTGLALKDVYGLDAEAAATILKVVGYDAEQVGQALKEAFGLAAVDATIIMDSIGFEDTEIGFTLANIYGLQPTETGQTMKDAGISIERIYAALTAVWSDLADGDIVQLYYDIGYLAADVAQWLYDGLSWTGDQIIAGLEAVGYAAADVAQWLYDGLSWTGDQIIAGLEAVGYAAADVAQWLYEGLSWTGDQIIAGLEAVGYAAADVAQWLYDGLSWTGDQIIAGLEAVGYAAADVAQWLYDGLSWTGDQIIAGLEAVGYAAADVAQWLYDGLSWTGDQIIAGLEAVGYAAADVAQWLYDSLSWTADQVIAGLEAVGYAAAEVAQWLYEGLSWTGEQIMEGLKQVGYAAEEVAEWLGDALSWTAEQIANALNTVWGLGQDAIGYVLDGLGYAADFIEDLLGDIFGTIICTELHRQGYLADDVYAADAQFGIYLDRHFPTVREGYRFLAAPVVRQMQQSKTFTDVVYFFAEPWAEEMAYRAGVLEQGNFWGSVIMFFGLPLCFIVGIFVSMGVYSIIPLFLLTCMFFAWKKGYLHDPGRRIVYTRI